MLSTADNVLFLVHDNEPEIQTKGDEGFTFCIEDKAACTNLVNALRKDPNKHLGRIMLAHLCWDYPYYRLTEEDRLEFAEACKIANADVHIGSLHRICKHRLYKNSPFQVESISLPRLNQPLIKSYL